MPLPLLGYSMGMEGTREKLTAAVESYLGDSASHRGPPCGATGERSYYPALTNLLNARGCETSDATDGPYGQTSELVTH